MTNINPNTPMEKMTPGGDIYTAGNAREFKTGDWRSVKPIFLSEKCKQCGLCFPVCPDDAIPVNSDLKREDFDYDYCTYATSFAIIIIKIFSFLITIYWNCIIWANRKAQTTLFTFITIKNRLCTSPISSLKLFGISSCINISTNC